MVALKFKSAFRFFQNATQIIFSYSLQQSREINEYIQCSSGVSLPELKPCLLPRLLPIQFLSTQLNPSPTWSLTGMPGLSPAPWYVSRKRSHMNPSTLTTFCAYLLPSSAAVYLYLCSKRYKMYLRFKKKKRITRQ